MRIQTLALGAIRLDGGTQSRVEIDSSTVAEYAECYRAGDELPPIVVFVDGAGAWLADGHHRYLGRKAAGLQTIECDVRDGTRRDAILFSVGANAAHGLRRTTADKRKAVRTLLDDEEWSQLSDREIARRCGVTHMFVGAIRSPEVAARQKELRQQHAAGVASDATRQANEVASDATRQANEVASDATRPTIATPIPAPSSGPVTTITPPAAAPAAAESAGEAPEAATPGSVQPSGDVASPAPQPDLTPEQLFIKEAEETLAELQRLQAIVDSDEPLKAALDENKRLEAQVRQLRESLNGQVNKNNELIRRVGSLERKLKKAGVK